MPSDSYVGVSYLMSEADVPLRKVSSCGSERADRCLPRPAHHLFSFKLLIKNRNMNLRGVWFPFF